MNAASAGSIASGFQLGYAVSLVIFSWFADRIGPKPIFLGSMSLSAVFALLFAFFARDYTSALVLYTLVALSLGGSYTTGMMILADQYPVARRGMAIGFFIASTSLGYALSLLISGLAMPAGGYRLSFLLTCLGPLAGAILSWITLFKTRVSKAKRVQGERLGASVLKNRPALLLIGGYSFHNWELQGMWTWTPAFLASYLALGGMGGLKATGFGSNLSSLFHLTGLFASFTMGALSDRLGRGKIIFTMALTSAACSFAFGWTIEWPLAVVLIIGLVYAFSALGDSPVLSAALTEVVPHSYMGAAFGIRSLVGFGAAAAAPLVFGAILDLTNPDASGPVRYTSWGWAYASLGAAGLGAVYVAWRYGRLKTPRHQVSSMT
jgi:MFS family permease